MIKLSIKLHKKTKTFLENLCNAAKKSRERRINPTGGGDEPPVECT
jgi:hypothetical protein